MPQTCSVRGRSLRCTELVRSLVSFVRNPAGGAIRIRPPEGGPRARPSRVRSGSRTARSSAAARTWRSRSDPNRDFGSFGLSWASDRWDLRRALVLEGTGREGARSVVWGDLQTLYPLYFASYDPKGEPVDVGYWVGRFSGEQRAVDPVGAAFTNLRLGGSWRRESWEITSAPEPDGDVRRALSIGNLTKPR